MQERRKARQQALHILYQREITGERLADILARESWSEEDGEPTPFCREILAGVEAHQSTIDEAIESISENWVLSRMPIVDRSSRREQPRRRSAALRLNLPPWPFVQVVIPLRHVLLVVAAQPSDVEVEPGLLSEGDEP